jgi:hypothetical protein
MGVHVKVVRGGLQRVCAALALALGAAFGPAAAGADEAQGQPVDGVRCDQMEGSVFHIHQHVAIFDHGRPVGIASDVGRPLTANCLYWLHTHTSDGIIHVESPVFRTFTLGQFFDIWGEPLSASAAASARGPLRVYVDGSAYRGDPRKIELDQHADIVIEVGPPYRKPVPFTDWKGQ